MVFTEAFFTSSKKDYIDTVAIVEGLEFPEAILVPADLENPDYLELLEQFTIDEITTMTNQRHEVDKANFTAFVKNMCIDYGLVYDPNAADQQDRLTVDHIFNPAPDDLNIDFLFNIKIKIFEMPEVEGSTNAALKKQLREAKTPLESLYIAGKFLYE